jgi:hypothetical protein
MAVRSRRTVAVPPFVMWLKASQCSRTVTIRPGLCIAVLSLVELLERLHLMFMFLVNHLMFFMARTHKRRVDLGDTTTAQQSGSDAVWW